MQSSGALRPTHNVYPGCHIPRLSLCGLVFLFNHRLRANIIHPGTWNYPAFPFFSRKSLNAPLYLSLLLSYLWPGQVLINSHQNYSKSVLALCLLEMMKGMERAQALRSESPGLNSYLHYAPVVQSLWASLSSPSTHHGSL